MQQRSVAALALTALVAAAGASGCGVEQLPAARPPSRTLPAEVEVPPDPPPPGSGRVILDTDGEPASVVEITSGSVPAGASSNALGDNVLGVRPLCTTPCVVDLPYGSHPIVLRSTSDETHQSETELDVGARAKVFRHTLGERTDGGGLRMVGASLLTLGILAVAAGTVMWAAGVTSSRGSPNLTTNGEVLTMGGAGGIVLSIPFLIMGRPTERPGSTTQWSLPGAPPERASPPYPPGAAFDRQ
ncbi:MAG: hypothetical protein JWO86_3343 [Myxococcaceae bacterium]|nr:hypothetical protein [Myxococcaceae bacterium]